MFTFSKKTIYKIIPIIIVFSLNFIIRAWIISDYNIMYFFDQSRDSIVSREIIENHDIKIQGPSASGTNDTIFHGVFYYYLISPIYTISKGNPIAVEYFLITLSSIAAILLYFFSLKFTKNTKISFLSVLLITISFKNVYFSTWISNPTIALIPIIGFYWLYWDLYFLKKANTSKLILFGITLGLINQAALFTIYLWGPVLIGLFYLNNFQKDYFSKQFKLNNIFVFLFSYTLTIGTMILTQFKLYQANIFSFQKLFNLLNKSFSFNDSNQIFQLIDMFTKELIMDLSPNHSFWLIPILMITIYGFIHLKKEQKLFFAIMLSSSIWLTLIQFKDSTHTMIGFEFLILLLFSIALYNINQKFKIKIITIFIVLLYIYSQVSSLIYAKNNKFSPFVVEKGTTLNDQINLIDEVYKIADKKPFTFSSYTNPYGWNTTWTNIFSWYGNSKYHYLPKFFGPDQNGIFGGELLEYSPKPEKIHFSIIEHDTGVDKLFYNQFIHDQNAFAGEIVINEEFGTLELQARNKSVENNIK